MHESRNNSRLSLEIAKESLVTGDPQLQVKTRKRRSTKEESKDDGLSNYQLHRLRYIRSRVDEVFSTAKPVVIPLANHTEAFVESD